MAYATRHTLQEYKGYFALSQIIYIENLLKSTNTQKTIYRYLQELTAAHIIINKGYLRTEETEVSILIVNWTNI